MSSGAQDHLALLERTHPQASYYLHFDTPFHLVLAAILSAQCTDVAVNKATPALFTKYNAPSDVLQVTEDEIAKDIRAITYFQAKAKYIKRACETLVRDFHGEVPKDIEHLTRLAGVGRKTANAIQQNAFGLVSGIIVDTHVMRIAQRLGWTRKTRPGMIERDLMALFPKEKWKRLPHLLKNHGQRVCTAQRPKCDACVLAKTCPSAFRV